MAIVLANPDGTVYHRYGGRSDVSPMNMDTLIEVMKEGLVTHRNHGTDSIDSQPQKPLPAHELVNDRMRENMNPVYGCVHCHYVREAQQYAALESRTWTPNQFWIWPLPKRIGLIMNQERQYEVEEVISNSPAARAEIQAGDRLQTLGGKRVLTQYDIQWTLDRSDDDAIELPFTLRRNQQRVAGNLKLETAWKTGDPEDYDWRVRNVFTEHMSKFLPTPGLIGDQLSDEELDARDLPKETFALKVTRLNQGSHLAGVRLGDVVLGAGGKSDFEGKRDFFHWCEIKRRAGGDIQMRLLRGESRISLMVSQRHLNYLRVEKAPQVAIGFIIQELAGDGGLRVGNVTDGSSAEKTGLRVGDRILSVEGLPVRDYDELQDILNQKSPGDLLLVHVQRADRKFQFSYVLPGEDAQNTEVARLSDKVVESGQQLTCTVSIQLPEGKHVYSMHKEGFGLPTSLGFRGRGFRLMGPTTEPSPVRVDGGISPMWILEGDVEFRQRIQITDPGKFLMVLDVFAQVCDDRNCHEFRATVSNDGSSTEFFEFRGNSAAHSEVSRSSISR
jgi:membrane-associated protease RseP (regulator of RpoE activity)